MHTVILLLCCWCKKRARTLTSIISPDFESSASTNFAISALSILKGVDSGDWTHVVSVHNRGHKPLCHTHPFKYGFLVRMMGVEPIRANCPQRSQRCMSTIPSHPHKVGAPGGIRTPNRPVRSRLLYPFSYERAILFWYTKKDSNLQPSDPKSDALSILAIGALLLIWCRQRESNPRHSDYKTATLPTELYRQ